jgi:hypothetical protein
MVFGIDSTNMMIQTTSTVTTGEDLFTATPVVLKTTAEKVVTTSCGMPCPSAKPCLHDGSNNNTCYSEMNLHGEYICPQGSTNVFTSGQFTPTAAAENANS